MTSVKVEPHNYTVTITRVLGVRAMDLCKKETYSCQEGFPWWWRKFLWTIHSFFPFWLSFLVTSTINLLRTYSWGRFVESLNWARGQTFLRAFNLLGPRGQNPLSSGLTAGLQTWWPPTADTVQSDLKIGPNSLAKAWSYRSNLCNVNRSR